MQRARIPRGERREAFEIGKDINFLLFLDIYSLWRTSRDERSWLLSSFKRLTWAAGVWLGCDGMGSV